MWKADTATPTAANANCVPLKAGSLSLGARPRLTQRAISSSPTKIAGCPQVQGMGTNAFAPATTAKSPTPIGRDKKAAVAQWNPTSLAARIPGTPVAATKAAAATRRASQVMGLGHRLRLLADDKAGYSGPKLRIRDAPPVKQKPDPGEVGWGDRLVLAVVGLNNDDVNIFA